MEREILFRAKRSDNKEWIEGLLMASFDGNYSIQVRHDFDGMEYFSTHKVIPETVGQFTGLCDKNGVKTYDSDIFRSPSHFEDGILMYNYHVIEWSDKYCGWFAKNIGNIGKEDTHGDVQLWVYFRNCEPEVIGNIHDNQELLKND